MGLARVGVISIFVIFLAAFVTAPTVQHHPFSELFPPDQDLNFGEYDAFNLTELDLSDGSIFTGNVVRNQGNTIDIIRFIDSGLIEIPNGGIEVSGSSKFQNNVEFRSSGDTVKLNGTGGNHTYMEFYKESSNPGVRSAWVGYGSASRSAFTIKNELGDKIELKGGKVEAAGGVDLKGNNLTSSTGGEICVGRYC
ncbi:MAG: hypothetical protein H8Z69_00485 [Nanohaloarchaea archaeon]|nr:hypothetical protein [Candidatus Nanohaloarchaea archaeon]